MGIQNITDAGQDLLHVWQYIRAIPKKEQSLKAKVKGKTQGYTRAPHLNAATNPNASPTHSIAPEQRT